MPLWTDLLIGDTTHLSTEEFGAYLLILIATWRNNAVPFPDDPKKLARICRCTPTRWLKVLRPAVAPFFDLSGHTFRQKRLEKELEFVENRRATNVAKGVAGAEAKRLKKNQTNSAHVDLGINPEGEVGVKQPTLTLTSLLRKQELTPPNPPLLGKGGLTKKRVRREAELAPPEQPWEARLRHWVADGFWLGSFGPRPEEPDCWVPAELLRAAKRERALKLNGAGKKHQ